MLDVRSEVGRLRRVLVHEPGPEVDRMVPAMMAELLFDDILFGDRAREEHRRFCRVLRLLSVEVVHAQDLLAECLAQDGARAYVGEVVADDLRAPVRERLQAASPRVLAEMLVGGVRLDASSAGGAAGRGPAAAKGIEAEELFEVPPLPNYCFQRDPQIVLGDGVVIGAMATPARSREALLARAIFRFHPALADAPVLLDPLQPHGERHLLAGLHRPWLEGGDVLVLAPDVVAVGVSERTNRQGVTALVRALARREGGPRYLLAVELPRKRAYMHLDTLFTPIDRDAALVFPPVICDDGPESARVYEYDLHEAEPAASAVPDLFAALRRRGVDLEPIPCGGADPVVQQREQWTDGANAFAIAPGLITLYDRNTGTAEELARRGFRVLLGDDLLLGRAELDPDHPGRACILLASHEISRARGGPHCLTHPLVRDRL